VLSYSATQHNQRSVVRRLVEERDNARKDLDYRRQAQREESERSERELLELRTSLDTVHSQRVELEQIAEEAVTGREDLEKQTAQLERALKKKEQESVGRNEYHLLQEECENLKLFLRENDIQLKRFKANVSERTTSISKLQIDLQSLDEEKGELVSHLEKERTLVDKLGGQNKHFRAELDSTRSQIIILENERNLLQSQMASTKRSLELSLDRKDGFAKNLSGEVEELQNELHLAKTQLLENDALVLRLQHFELTGTQEIEALRQNIVGLEEEMKKIRTSKEELARDLTARLLDIKDLSQALRDVTVERDSAEDNLAEKERQLEESKAKVQQIKSDTVAFRDEAGRSLASVVARHEETSTIIKEQTSEIDELSRKNEGLRRQVELLQREKETAEATVEDFKYQLDRVVDTRTTAVSHREHLELERLQESNYLLESKVEGLLREVKEQKRLSNAEQMERLRSEAEPERRASLLMESSRAEGLLDRRNTSERFAYHRSGEQSRLRSQTPATYAHDDEYRRLEEVTVSLAQALHSQSRIDEEDVAHLLRQFHAAEDAVVSHNRYFRSRVEGQLRSK
jgi:chromosome segregation ATPase